MSWKDDLKHAMINVLVRKGSPVRERPDIYGWEDYDWEAEAGHHVHPKRLMVQRVGIDYAATVYREIDWYEFAGTFAPEQNHVYGVEVDLVLMDGTRLHWRYGGNLSALIQAVLEEPEPTREESINER